MVTSEMTRISDAFFPRSSCDEESWGDEDVESHGDAFVSGEFQQEENNATPPDGSSTEEAVKGRKGR